MVKFCWWCGRKLQGNHYKVILDPMGYEKVCHKWCANAIEEGRKNLHVSRDDKILIEQSYNQSLDLT